MQPSHGPRKLFRRRRSHLALILAGGAALAVVATAAVWWLGRSGGPVTGVVPSPSTPAGPTASASPSVTGTPKIKGVVVQVLNGTTRKRFAATTSRVLAKAGYTTTSPANSESRRNVTLIAYQPRFGADAAFIQQAYFPRALLQEAFVPFASGADITVLLGRDALG